MAAGFLSVWSAKSFRKTVGFIFGAKEWSNIEIKASGIEADLIYDPDRSYLESADGQQQIGCLDNIYSPVVNVVSDIDHHLLTLHSSLADNGVAIFSVYNWAWRPIIVLAELLRLKTVEGQINWMSTQDSEDFIARSEFILVKTVYGDLFPAPIANGVNRYIGSLPVLQRFAFRKFFVLRKQNHRRQAPFTSASVVIPCKNEAGNIENAVRQINQFCDDLEIIFVEGGSVDGTAEEIQRVRELYADKNIVHLTQNGVGKGSAVRQAFEYSRKEVLMILDADLTVAPNYLDRFFSCLQRCPDALVQGTRLIYPMEEEAMRFLNYLGNRFFAFTFSWLLNQRLSDTLCGTKVLARQSYLKIAAERSYFGEFDPFGDFDLIFGASRQNMPIIEIPVRYGARSYGETQISRFRHGILLLRMTIFAFKKLKMV